MNTEKVGRFIAEQRKRKSLTQKQLADLLNVTDKAVSRWETGKGYPDIETLKALSEKLDVSLNELLSGEFIPNERAAEKAEQHIVDAYKKEKRTRKKSTVVVSLVLALCIAICAVFAFNLKSYKKREYIATIDSVKTGDMITQLEYLLWENCRIGGREIYEQTVCTDFNIRMNTDNEILEFYMELQNNDYGYRTEISAFHGQNQNQFRIIHEHVGSEKAKDDGFTYSSIMNALKNVDLIALCKKHAPKGESYSELWVNFADETTFSENIAQFGSDNQYLYKNGELIFADTTEMLIGKHYVFTLIPKIQVQENEAYSSCCNVYIKR